MSETAGLFIIDDAHPERSVDGSSEITIEYRTRKAKDWETSRNLGFFHATKQWKEGKRIKRKKEEGTGDGSQNKTKGICFPVLPTITH